MSGYLQLLLLLVDWVLLEAFLEALFEELLCVLFCISLAPAFFLFFLLLFSMFSPPGVFSSIIDA